MGSILNAKSIRKLITTGEIIFIILAVVLIGCSRMEKTESNNDSQLIMKNIITNGDFEIKNLDSWTTFQTGSGEISTEIKENELEVTVTPGEEPYNPQVLQEELLFTKGKTYTIKFFARAETARKMLVNVGSFKNNNWTQFAPAPKMFQLGAAMQGYTFSFDMNEDSDFGKVSFEFGTIEDEAIATKVYIDNIQVVESGEELLDKTPVSKFDIIQNGHFDIDLNKWEKNDNQKIEVFDQKLFAEQKDPENKKIISQSGLKLIKDKEYIISFKGKAKTKSQVKFILTNKKETKIYAEKLFDLETANAVENYRFRMNEKNDKTTKLNIEFVDNQSENSAIYLDKISIKKIDSLYLDPNADVELRVEDLLSKMTITEKLGQMVQAERLAVSSGNITEYGIGSLLSGGGSAPSKNKPESWAKMYDKFQAEALATRLEIPLIYGIDAVHGHTNVMDATGFPHNIGLGASRNPELLKKIGEVTALEVAATGIDWNFSPAVSVTRDERWGRSYESYGELPELQNLLAKSYIEGLQGIKSDKDGFMQGRKVVGTAKHFIADGGAEWGTGEGRYTVDRGDVTVFGEVTDSLGKTIVNSDNFKELLDIHGQGYIEAVDANIGTIMASFNMLNGIHMHNNKVMLDYLKAPVEDGGLGFDGFIIGDWDAMSLITEIESGFAERVIASFNAGLDMSMEQSKWLEVITILKRGLAEGKINQERIDDAVRRILRIKFRAGLFEYPLSDRDMLSEFGTEENRIVAAQAVRESMVLLKNENNILPLDKKAKIYVTGPHSNNVGLQNGGWTVSWQGGQDTRDSKLTKGTTILEGIRKIVETKGGEVITDKELADTADVAVVVIGEKPYAEGVGDIQTWDDMNLTDGKAHPQNMIAIQRALDTGLPTVVIMISGRPLVISDEIEDWDAFVAAWLPGTEGGAMADVLFGNGDFKGKLPVTWPRDIDQLPINADDPDYGTGNRIPLFEYGVGLTMGVEESELEYRGIYEWLEANPMRKAVKLGKEN